MFTGSGSSSAACEEVEVLEIPPPAMDRSSKPKFSNQKEVSGLFLLLIVL